MKNITMLLLGCLFPVANFAGNISFLDEHVKSVCVQNWDTDGDGELNMEEAAAVTNLNTAFAFDAEIVNFPELRFFTGLSNIAMYDFYSCNSLRSVILPPQINNIGVSAFFGCVSLQEIDIPEAVKNISDFAFNGCSRLQTVTFHEGLTTIGENAFSSCNSLQSLSIPSTVTSIALSAFWSCSSLTSITVDPENSVYDSRDNCNALIKTSTNTLQLGITTSVIHETVTTIGTSAFYGNVRLQTINIPEGVKTIEGSAFSGCTALYNVTLPSTLTSIGYSAFGGCKKLSDITLPEGLATIGQQAFDGCSSFKKILIPSTVTSIGMNAFAGISRLTKVAAMATTPLYVFANAFPYRKKSTLYVPKGCSSAYRGATTWGDFAFITEFDNSIAVTVEPEAFEAGAAATLAVSLTNDDFFDYHSVKVDITLPQQFSLDAGNILLSERCSGMTAKLISLGNIYRLTCSSDNALISGTKGALFTLPLQIQGNVPAGTYNGIAKSAVLTSEYGNQQLGDMDFSWTVIGYALGDVNHDGDVSLVDVTALVNHILGVQQEAIFLENADMDGDTLYGITDVMMIADMILN